MFFDRNNAFSKRDKQLFKHRFISYIVCVEDFRKVVPIDSEIISEPSQCIFILGMGFGCDENTNSNFSLLVCDGEKGSKNWYSFNFDMFCELTHGLDVMIQKIS